VAIFREKFLRFSFFVPSPLPSFYKIFNRIHNFTSKFFVFYSVQGKNFPAKKLQHSIILHLFSLLKFAKFTYQFHNVKLPSSRVTPYFTTLNCHSKNFSLNCRWLFVRSEKIYQQKYLRLFIFLFSVQDREKEVEENFFQLHLVQF